MESTADLTNIYPDASEDLLASSESQLSEEESKPANEIQETDVTDTEASSESGGETTNATPENQNEEIRD
jgi:hypothetical protein